MAAPEMAVPEIAVPVLVLPPRYTADSNSLWKAAVDAGWDIARLPNWRVPPELQGCNVVVYGEPLFAVIVAQELNLQLVEPPLDFLAHLPQELTRRKVGFGTLAQARQIEEAVFIKPANEKTFEARVYASGAALPPLEFVESETPVLWSEPVTWDVEFRCFVQHGAVATFSPYWRGDATAQAADGSWPASADEQQAVLDFAGHVLREVALPQAVVLDVGLIAGRGWAVIEANPAFGSGIYGCDPAQVLKVVQAACISRSSLA